MIFLSIVFGITAFAVSFLLQIFFIIIMKHWITRLIPVLSILIISVIGISDYLSLRAYYAESRGFANIMTGFNLMIYQGILYNLFVGIIGCIVGIIVGVLMVRKGNR